MVYGVSGVHNYNFDWMSDSLKDADLKAQECCPDNGSVLVWESGPEYHLELVAIWSRHADH